MQAAEARLCYEVLGDVDTALREALPPDDPRYLVVGGVVSSALIASSTTIDTVGQVVIPTMAASDRVMRPNGTCRDIDILVPRLLSETEVDALMTTVQDAVDGQMVVSVFGFDEHIAAPTRLQRGAANLTSFISRRTIDWQGTLRYNLFPLEQEVAAETYDPWTLVLPTARTSLLQVLNPVGHVLAYDMRSISGRRAKDQAKVSEMARRVFANPQLNEVRHDGIFADWRQFGNAISRLRGARGDETGLRDYTTRSQVELARARAGLLHWAEAHPGIVNFAQGDVMQRLLSPFVGAMYKQAKSRQ